MKKYLILLSLSLFSCGGGSENPEPPDTEVNDPEAASLVYPENNSECEEGEILSDTQNRITFIWNESRHTDSYTLFVKDLEEDAVSSYSASESEKTVTLERGHPYSWYVVSKASGTAATASSPTWKFYNAGEAESNHAPFPAEAVSPARGATVAAGEIVLSWNTTDLDGDLQNEVVLFGESTPPGGEIEAGLAGEVSVTTESGKLYYWQVRSTDSRGNTTDSQIFSFRTQ